MSRRYYVGQKPEDLLKAHRSARFFYGMRTDGENLFIDKFDVLDSNDIIILNKIGDDPTANFPQFSDEEDFLEGRDEAHNDRYGNLSYPQYKWSDVSFTYYIDENGELTLRTWQGQDEGDPSIPFVPLNPVQIDFRRRSVFATFDVTGVTFDNTALTFDNEEQQ